jgi:hypothetical protein
MTNFQIETWALRVIASVESGQPNEDARVELKAEWPEDPKKVARQIAGHANAARGDPILWLIGIDQDRGVTGAAPMEMANWYAAVKAQFDGLAPAVHDLNIPWRQATVVALLFQTDRYPFVVKNPVFGTRKGGPAEREVPWREGTATRSADRSDLLRLLAPLQRIPSIEILSAWLSAYLYPDEKAPRELAWTLEVALYFVPRGEGRAVIPSHRCSASFELPTYEPRTTLGAPRFTSSAPDSLVKGTDSEAILDGPGRLGFAASARTPVLRMDLPEEVAAVIELLPVEAESSIVLPMKLSKVLGEDSPVRWASWRFNLSPT